MNLKDRLLQLGLQILTSPADGHCFLHSVISAMKSQLNQSTDIHAIKSLIFNETLSHHEVYKHFLPEPSHSEIFHGLRQYLINKMYNHSFVDIVPLILANAMKVNIEILDENINGTADAICIAPRIPSFQTIVVHRMQDHYNGLVTLPTASDRLSAKKDRVIKYSSSELKQLAITSTGCISRSVRKQLFANHIWRPSETQELPVSHLPQKRPYQDLIQIPIRPWHIPSILNTNTRSVLSKTDELSVLFRNSDIDIAGISETWLSGTVPSSLINIPGYNCFRHDREAQAGGGVLCYVKDTLPSSHLTHLECDEVESTWVLIKPTFLPRNISQILVGVIYHPPGKSDSLTVNHILRSVDHVTSFHPETGIIILGDFNRMNDSLLKSYPFSQIVRAPTRGNAVLDKVYTNIATYYSDATILSPIGLSDHNVVICPPKPHHKLSHQHHPLLCTVRSFDQNSRSSFAQALKAYDWSDFYRMNSCEDMTLHFYVTLQQLLDQHMPQKTVQRHSNDKPWVDDHFRHLIKLRQQAFTSGNQPMYRFFRNKVNRQARKLKEKYFKKHIKDLSNTDSGQWWKKTKSLLGQSSKSNNFQPLADTHTNGNLSHLASQINAVFASVSHDLTKVDPSEFKCNDPIPDEYIIRPEVVEKKLSKIKLHKSPGPDELPNWLLRDFAPVLSGPVCAIYNASLREGYIPPLWKQANVTPIAKVPIPSDINCDLRPISLLAVVMKILESIIGEWILDVIEPKLDPNQFGGLKKHSTSQALIKMLNLWHSIVAKGKSAHVMFLDFAKAFDRVDYHILLHKCVQLDVPPVLVQWLAAFLSNRQQRVRIGKEVSEWTSVNGGVPQGSWLGPLLFIVMINDLHTDTSCIKYMDDTTITTVVSPSSMSNMQEVMDSTKQWIDANNMLLNSKKSKDMLISFCKILPTAQTVTIDGQSVQRVSGTKLLGVLINSNLKWDDHVNYIYKKASSRIYFLKHLKRAGLSSEELRLYYITVIRSVIEYAAPAWFTSTTTAQKERLNHIQKRALRIITPDLPQDIAEHQLNIPPLNYRLEMLCKKMFLQMCSISHPLHDLLPSQQYSKYFLRNRHSFPLPKVNSQRHKNSFVPYSLYNFQ